MRASRNQHERHRTTFARRPECFVLACAGLGWARSRFHLVSSSASTLLLWPKEGGGPGTTGRQSESMRRCRGTLASSTHPSRPFVHLHSSHEFVVLMRRGAMVVQRDPMHWPRTPYPTSLRSYPGAAPMHASLHLIEADCI